jgi:prepilin-type N-terminal cleavage/methylation domain-containing protein
MRLSKNRQQHGFTIIEVMIVLAIAGLILLIVFLAVPALQRNARNTQRRNDAGQISAAIATYEANTNSAPQSVGVDPSPNTIDICGVSCSSSVGSSVRLGFYEATVVDPGAAVELHNPPDSPPYQDRDTEEIIVEVGRGCDPTNTFVGATANPKSYAVLYALETSVSPGYQSRCVEQ